MTSRPYCTFTIGDLVIGVDVERVQEVLRAQPVTPVPLAPPSVIGLLNLRGRVLSVIDGRRRLGLAATDLALDHSHLILRTGDEAVSLVVDGTGEIVDLDPDRFGPVPDAVPIRIRNLFVGSSPLDYGPLLGLDVDRALSVSMP